MAVLLGGYRALDRDPDGLATMGIGLPGGIAAKLAAPDCRVVVVSGTGDFS